MAFMQTTQPPDSAIPSTIQGVLISLLVLGTPHIIAALKALGGVLKARADSAAAQVVTLEILNQRLTADEQARKEARADWERRLGEVEGRSQEQLERALAAERDLGVLKGTFEESEAGHATRYGEYEKQVGVLRLDLSNLTRAYGEQGETLETEKRGREALAAEVEQLRKDMATVTAERDELKQENAALKQEQARLQGELNQHAARIKELESAVPKPPPDVPEGTAP